jgi:hypothetical protein
MIPWMDWHLKIVGPIRSGEGPETTAAWSDEKRYLFLNFFCLAGLHTNQMTIKAQNLQRLVA